MAEKVRNKQNLLTEALRKKNLFVEALRKAGWSRKAASAAWKRLAIEPSPRAQAESTGKDLMNYREAAAFLGVAELTLRHWICSRSNGIPFLKYGNGRGGSVKFRRASLLRWLETRERGGEQLVATPALVRSVGGPQDGW
jgi:excisionase family DNA binding protein